MSLAGVVRIFALSAALTAAIGAAHAQGPGEDGEVAAARLATRQQPTGFEAWMHRVAIESMQAVMQSATSGEADPQAAGERRFREILAEWKAARPRDGGPYLAELWREPDSPLRQQKILDLAARFPDDPAMSEHASRVLAEQGKPTQAVELLESFVEAHPEVARGFELLAAAYEQNGNRPAAHDVAVDWLRRFPGEAAALAAWLRTVGAELTPAAIEEMVGGALPAVLENPLTEETRQLCYSLSTRREPGLAASGETCLELVAERGSTPDVRENAARELEARGLASGDEDSAQAAILALPPERRLAATNLMATRLQPPKDCPRIVALFESLATDLRSDGDLAVAIASGIQWCSDTFPARALYVSLFSAAPAEKLPRLIVVWRTRVNGRYFQDLPADRLLPIVQARWAENRGAPAIAEALDLLYEAAGLREERLALLLSEGAQGRWPWDPRRLIELAQEEILAGRPEGGVALLEGALARSPDDPSAFRASSEALLALDRKGEARALAERGLASRSPVIRAQSHLTLARLEMRHENVDAALAQYRMALDSAASPGSYVGQQELADEIFFVLALADRMGQLVALAEELCAGSGLRESGQSVESCVGSALAGAGEAPAAARYLEKALAEAPQKPELFNDAARALSAAGDRAGAERVLRERIAFDPGDEGAWAELGLVFSEAEDLEAHARVLAEAERATGSPSMMLRYQHAELQLKAGAARGAIETVLEMKRLRPDLDYFDDLLRQAYSQLGVQP